MASVLESLERRAREMPDALAFVVDGARLTYGALFREATSLGERLTACGLGRGRRVALLLPTGLDFVRAVFGVQLAGAAPVAIDPALPAPALGERLAATRPSLLLVDGIAARTIASSCEIARVDDVMKRTARAALPAHVDAEAPAYLQLTSGSTGAPRAAVISHRAVTAGLDAIASRFDLGSGDVMASWVPLHYSPGLVRYVFGTVHFGCPSHLVTASAPQLPLWLRTIQEVRATVTSSPDFAYRLAARLVAPGALDLGSLRVATSGGESIRVATIASFERQFSLQRVVQPAYGLAEATLIVTSAAPGESLVADADGRAACGRALNGVEVRIVSDRGTDVDTGVEGEIVVRSPALFDGYLDDEESTRAALHDGWLYTGDIGTLDERGRLFVTGRARALIKRGGRGLAPRAIEEAVERVAGIVGSAAVGLPRPDATEALVVFAEVQAPLESWSALVGQVERAVAEQVGIVPSRIVIVRDGAVPRTSTGKVRYAELQRLAADPAFGRHAYFES